MLPVEKARNSASNISTTNLTCASMADSYKRIHHPRCLHIPSLSFPFAFLSPANIWNCAVVFLLISFSICQRLTDMHMCPANGIYSNKNYPDFTVLRSMANAFMVFMVYNVTTKSVTVSVWIANAKRCKHTQHTHGIDVQSDYTTILVFLFFNVTIRRHKRMQIKRIFVLFFQRFVLLQMFLYYSVVFIHLGVHAIVVN